AVPPAPRLADVVRRAFPRLRRALARAADGEAARERPGDAATASQEPVRQPAAGLRPGDALPVSVYHQGGAAADWSLVAPHSCRGVLPADEDGGTVTGRD